jgi:hypothetical protein
MYGLKDMLLRLGTRSTAIPFGLLPEAQSIGVITTLQVSAGWLIHEDAVQASDQSIGHSCGKGNAQQWVMRKRSRLIASGFF